MTLNWKKAHELAQEHGRSFFVLSADKFRENFFDLRGAFRAHYPDVEIGYSYKTNYTPQLCQIVHELGGYAEVVSSMEYALAKRLGIPGSRTIFNGPYKGKDAFVDAALSGATLNLDSMRDLRMLKEISSAGGSETISVVLRCNFPLSSGEISRFGMDVDGEEFRTAIEWIAGFDNVKLKGLHCHFPDRDLDSFGRRAEKMVALVNRVFPQDLPEILNIGGGYYSNMPEELRSTFETPPASFSDYGKLVGETLSRGFSGRGRLPTLFLEPGTAIVADTQSFYTQVISTKTVANKNFATVAGSGFDISPTARSRNLPVATLHQNSGGDQDQLFDIVGYTCIEKDILSENVRGPIKVDDFMCYSNVGSYSVVMRPPFILPSNPVLMEADGELSLIKERQTSEDVFQNYKFD